MRPEVRSHRRRGGGVPITHSRHSAGSKFADKRGGKEEEGAARAVSLRRNRRDRNAREESLRCRTCAIKLIIVPHRLPSLPEDRKGERLDGPEQQPASPDSPRHGEALRGGASKQKPRGRAGPRWAFQWPISFPGQRFRS